MLAAVATPKGKLMKATETTPNMQVWASTATVPARPVQLSLFSYPKLQSLLGLAGDEGWDLELFEQALGGEFVAWTEPGLAGDRLTGPS